MSFAHRDVPPSGERALEGCPVEGAAVCLEQVLQRQREQRAQAVDDLVARHACAKPARVDLGPFVEVGERVAGDDRVMALAAGQARSAFDALDLMPVRTPIGDARILSSDEPAFRERAEPAAAARLLPSGDTYYLLKGADRERLKGADARGAPAVGR